MKRATTLPADLRTLMNDAVAAIDGGDWEADIVKDAFGPMGIHPKTKRINMSGLWWFFWKLRMEQVHDKQLEIPTAVRVQKDEDGSTVVDEQDAVVVGSKAVGEDSDDKANRLNRPLCEYWINSSHNTYVQHSSQLAGKASAEAYTRVLKNGARCIEIDLWPKGDKDVVVTHGHTIMESVDAKSVLEAVKAGAFVSSPYPVILTLEDHLGEAHQDEFTRLCLTVLGKSNIASHIDIEEITPEELRNKYILRCNWSKIKSAKYKKIIGIKQVSFKSLEANTSIKKRVASQSIPEGLLQSYEGDEDMLRLMRGCLVRTYPDGVRIDSSNFDPTIQFALGAQLVSLNFQTRDTGALINMVHFSSTGSGYVEKPKAFLDGLIDFAPTHELEVNVVSLRNVLATNGKLTPAVEMHLVNVETGTHMRYKTRHLSSFMFLGVYNQVFHVPVTRSANEYLIFTVVSAEASESVLAYAAINTVDAKKGMRWLQLNTMGKFQERKALDAARLVINTSVQPLGTSHGNDTVVAASQLQSTVVSMPQSPAFKRMQSARSLQSFTSNSSIKDDINNTYARGANIDLHAMGLLNLTLTSSVGRSKKQIKNLRIAKVEEKKTKNK